MYTIEEFKKINRLEGIIVTQHSRKRFAERQISIDDIMAVINSGEIIEQYTEDYPFPSCLIFGCSGSRSIHLVASIDEDMIYIITAYVPSPDKWESGWRRRKGE